MKKGILGPYIIGSAVVWGAVLVGTSLIMRGSEHTTQVLSLLGAGAGAHLIIIWGPLAAAIKKLRDELSVEQGD